MKILEVTQRYPPALGGVERHVEQLSRELVRGGATVEVCTTDLAKDRPFERLHGTVPHDTIPVRRHPAYPWFPAPLGLGIGAPGMLAELLRTRVDVVHAHAFGYAPTWFAAVARRLRGGPLVLTTHSDEGRGGWFSSMHARVVARAALRAADVVVALTEHESSRLLRLGVDPARIRVLPNGIDLSEFPSPRPAPDRPGLRVLYVGRIYPEQKGLDVLLEAVAQTSPTSDVSLRLLGEDWGSWPGLARRSERLGIAGKVRYLGTRSRSALREEYAEADVVVLPSRFEPFGIVLLEAMAAARPIVASRVGGIPEVVRDDENGLLVPPGDPMPLAGALDRLAQSPELRRRMGARGRELVAPYDWRTLGPKFLAMFREVAESRRGA